MKRMKVLTVLCAAALLLSGCSNAVDVPQTEPVETLPVEEGPVRPQDDFYAATNAELLATHATGENSGAWNWFFDLEEQAFRDQKQIIQAAVPGWGAGLSPEAPALRYREDSLLHCHWYHGHSRSLC